MTSDIKFYLELFKKRLPVMAVIFVICAAIGAAMAMTLPPKYRATASLLVEGAQLPDTLFTTTVQTQAARELQAIQLRLMTRANLIDIASKYEVFDGVSAMSPDTIVIAMREATDFELFNGGRDRTTTLRISFNAGDPNTAADVVNEYVTYVLRADADRRTGESGETLEFFKSRVERLADRLSTQSASIVEFKEANADALPENQEYRLDRQSTLRERRNLIGRDRTALIEQRNRLLAVGNAAVPTQQLTPQELELNRLETELRSKLAIYAPDSPTIEFLRKRIDILRSSEPIDGATGVTNDVNTVLELQITEVDSRIQSLKDELETLEAELAELEAAIERTPKVAIQLDKLEREYETTQTQYSEAILARSTAEQGVDVEISAKGERVALVERATVPEEPDSPNRKLIAGGGVFLGSVLAAAFFTLTELLNRTIRRPIDLTRGLGVQPLATIPHLEPEGTQRLRQYVKIFFVLLALIAIPAALWAVHVYYLPLDLLVDQLAETMGL